MTIREIVRSIIFAAVMFTAFLLMANITHVSEFPIIKWTVIGIATIFGAFAGMIADEPCTWED